MQTVVCVEYPLEWSVDKVTSRPILAEVVGPDGVRVVLFEDTWLRHILNPQSGHAELGPYLKSVLDTVERRTTANKSLGLGESDSSSETSALLDG